MRSGAVKFALLKRKFITVSVGDNSFYDMHLSWLMLAFIFIVEFASIGYPHVFDVRFYLDIGFCGSFLIC